VNDSIVDGPGLRLAVFVQGCPHGCPGCHNPQTHDRYGGYEADTGDILQTISANPLLTGLTISGGEPFWQPEPLAALCRGAKALGLHVIVYTGYTWAEILRDEAKLALARQADIVIDGPFVAAEKSLELRFKGSRNQRVIDAAQSLAAGEVVEAEL